MRLRSLFPAIVVAVLLTFGSSASQDMDPVRAREIIDQVDRLMRGDSSHGQVEMRVVTDRWSRTLGMEIWSLGTEKALVRITSPRKEAGTATLKDGSDIWNYLPKIDRTIRVPSSMMSGAWMGSHFSNDDLVKESRLVTDYEIRLSDQLQRDDAVVYEFTLIPRPDAAVVWGSIVFLVRRDDLIPLETRYYDEDGELKRTMHFLEVRQMGGRRVPTVMRLVPADEPGEFTEMVYSELEFDIEISERMFSLSALRR